MLQACQLSSPATQDAAEGDRGYHRGYSGSHGGAGEEGAGIAGDTPCQEHCCQRGAQGKVGKRHPKDQAQRICR
jgi:hypothetical protein